MARRFEGKVVLVTGGGSGMGEATARRMAEEGATVSVIDLDAGGGERVVEAIGLAGGAASFPPAAISKSPFF